MRVCRADRARAVGMDVLNRLRAVLSRPRRADAIKPPIPAKGDADPLPPGSHLGDYIIDGELAPARMGRVYRALDTKRNRTVAINVLAPALRTDSGRSEFFHNVHAAALHADQVPGLSVLDFGEIDGVYVAVLEYVEGGSDTFDVTEVLRRRSRT